MVESYADSRADDRVREQPAEFVSVPGGPRLWRGSVVAVAVLLVAVVAVIVIVRGGEGVTNGAVTRDLSGWGARSGVGSIEKRRVPVHAPEGITTAIQLRQPEAEQRNWARALVELKDPTGFLEVGRTYRLRAFVRNANANGQSIGLLLADQNYAARPMQESTYESFSDDAWHELALDFTCTSPPSPETGVYIALPTSGSIDWQITGVSLKRTKPLKPPQVKGEPDRVLAFDGAPESAPDPRYWNHAVGGGGWGNDELQSYTSDVRNASLDGQGQLLITARRERATGEDGITRDFTSARINTQGKLNVTPGSYVEAPIQAPVGTGIWPAFWLLGSNLDEVGWPACGELDVMEVLGSNTDMAKSALHMASASDSRRDMPYGIADEGGSVQLPRGVDKQMHSYGVYFDQEMVVFYIDRQPTLTYTAHDARVSGRTWPFDKSQFLILNVAVGGRESPTGTTFPRTMKVGAISIWKGGIPF